MTWNWWCKKHKKWIWMVLEQECPAPCFSEEDRCEYLTEKWMKDDHDGSMGEPVVGSGDVPAE